MSQVGDFNVVLKGLFTVQRSVTSLRSNIGSVVILNLKFRYYVCFELENNLNRVLVITDDGHNGFSMGFNGGVDSSKLIIKCKVYN